MERLEESFLYAFFNGGAFFVDIFDLEAGEGTNANPSVEGAKRQRMVAIDIDFILISKILCSVTSQALFNLEPKPDRG